MRGAFFTFEWSVITKVGSREFFFTQTVNLQVINSLLAFTFFTFFSLRLKDTFEVKRREDFI